jgi:hypothetical protein
MKEKEPRTSPQIRDSSDRRGFGRSQRQRRGLGGEGLPPHHPKPKCGLLAVIWRQQAAEFDYTSDRVPFALIKIVPGPSITNPISTYPPSCNFRAFGKGR